MERSSTIAAGRLELGKSRGAIKPGDTWAAMSRENVEMIRAALVAPFQEFLSTFADDAEFHAPGWGLDTAGLPV